MERDAQVFRLRDLTVFHITFAPVTRLGIARGVHDPFYQRRLELGVIRIRGRLRVRNQPDQAADGFVELPTVVPLAIFRCQEPTEMGGKFFGRVDAVQQP